MREDRAERDSGGLDGGEVLHRGSSVADTILSLASSFSVIIYEGKTNIEAILVELEYQVGFFSGRAQDWYGGENDPMARAGNAGI